MYVRKEAVLSSQIEGTQSSLSDLLTYELKDLPGAPVNDVEEVSNYVAAMNHALKRLKDLPLSLRLIREMHTILLSRGRGQKLHPGRPVSANLPASTNIPAALPSFPNDG